MTDDEKMSIAREKKKTNFQRLYRKSKKAEMLSHNFAEDIVGVTEDFLKTRMNKENFAAWKLLVSGLRKRYSVLARMQ